MEVSRIQANTIDTSKPARLGFRGIHFWGVAIDPTCINVGRQERT